MVLLLHYILVFTTIPYLSLVATMDTVQQKIAFVENDNLKPPSMSIHAWNLILPCNSTNVCEVHQIFFDNNVVIKHKSNKTERKNYMQESTDLYFYLN